MIAGAVCVIFGHSWSLFMVKGENGEPGEAFCERCRVHEVRHDMPCRCLGGCWCQPDVRPREIHPWRDCPARSTVDLVFVSGEAA